MMVGACGSNLPFSVSWRKAPLAVVTPCRRDSVRMKTQELMWRCIHILVELPCFSVCFSKLLPQVSVHFVVAFRGETSGAIQAVFARSKASCHNVVWQALSKAISKSWSRSSSWRSRLVGLTMIGWNRHARWRTLRDIRR